MKYIDEYRDKVLIKKLAEEIRRKADPARIYNIMEVCGTHTMSVFKFGLRDILPANINLMSGPGCPVCVTPNEFIDRAIAISKIKGVIIATFGDMLRVPGSYSSLDKEKALGADIRVVYSTIDALELARKNRSKEVVFLGVGFETTAPTVAASIDIARKEKLKNYSVLCAHKTMPEALEALVRSKDLKADSFLLPGHVSVIIGRKPYEFLSKRYNKRCVITGFEPLDIMQAILMIVEQKTPRVDIQYKRLIKEGGNRLAKDVIAKVFEKCDSTWRGMGVIKRSGLKIRKKYGYFDAEKRFLNKTIGQVVGQVVRLRYNKNCICGDVLKGAKTPKDCGLFGKRCTPENPVGSCMVSGEGTCAAWYKYSYKL